MKDNMQEEFIVVDKDDNILTFRTRYDCHHDKSLIHRAIGIIITNDKGEILLQKRSKYKDLQPGKYTISVSGHVTRGQTYEDAATREMNEELGIQTAITCEKKFLMKSPQETEMDTIFTAHSNGPFSPAKDEVEWVEFVSQEKIKKMQDKFTPFAWQCLEQMKIV